MYIIKFIGYMKSNWNELKFLNGIDRKMCKIMIMGVFM